MEHKLIDEKEKKYRESLKDDLQSAYCNGGGGYNSQIRKLSVFDQFQLRKLAELELRIEALENKNKL